MSIPKLYYPVARCLALCAGVLVLAACSIAPVPQVALDGVEARAFRKLRSEDLNPYVTGYDRPLMLVVGDARLTNDGLERRAYITPTDAAPIYLGALSRQWANVPLEMLCLDLEGDRFIVIWVDEMVAGTPTTVTFGRPMQQSIDDSMNTLRVAAVANRVAIVPIAAVEAALWQEINDIRVQTRQEHFAWQARFEPPLAINNCFTSITLP